MARWPIIDSRWLAHLLSRPQPRARAAASADNCTDANPGLANHPCDCFAFFAPRLKRAAVDNNRKPARQRHEKIITTHTHTPKYTAYEITPRQNALRLVRFLFRSSKGGRKLVCRGEPRRGVVFKTDSNVCSILLWWGAECVRVCVCVCMTDTCTHMHVYTHTHTQQRTRVVDAADTRQITPAPHSPALLPHRTGRVNVRRGRRQRRRRPRMMNGHAEKSVCVHTHTYTRIARTGSNATTATTTKNTQRRLHTCTPQSTLVSNIIQTGVYVHRHIMKGTSSARVAMQLLLLAAATTAAAVVVVVASGRSARIGATSAQILHAPQSSHGPMCNNQLHIWHWDAFRLVITHTHTGDSGVYLLSTD